MGDKSIRERLTHLRGWEADLIWAEREAGRGGGGPRRVQGDFEFPGDAGKGYLGERGARERAAVCAGGRQDGGAGRAVDLGVCRGQCQNDEDTRKANRTSLFIVPSGFPLSAFASQVSHPDDSGNLVRFTVFSVVSG